jgi:DNA-binding transcriptional LysR family regulator
MISWNLRQLAHFLAVVEANSLSKAARKLGLSQPALTASIRKLESALGFEVFERKDAFRMTDLGKSFFPSARRALGQMDDLDREIALLRDGSLGDLRLGSGPTLADAVVGGVIAGLLRRAPGINISLKVTEVYQLPALLREQKVDLAVGDITEVEHNPTFLITPLAPQEIKLFCRAEHPLTGRPSVSPSEFFQYPLASTSLPSWALKWLQERNPDGPIPQLSVECSHHAALKTIVEQSDAISAAPWTAIEAEIKTGRLAILNLQAPPLYTRAGIMHLRGRTLSPAARMFIAEATKPGMQS